MGLERHEVHDLEVWQPYSGHQSFRVFFNIKKIQDFWHLGKMLMLTAIISLLEVSLLASRLVKTEHLLTLFLNTFLIGQYT